MTDSAGVLFQRLLDVMQRLREPDGCPWDREQTPTSLKPFLIEEAYEVLEAIESGRSPAIREELGDLLFQIDPRPFQAEVRLGKAGLIGLDGMAGGLPFRAGDGMAGGMLGHPGRMAFRALLVDRAFEVLPAMGHQDSDSLVDAAAMEDLAQHQQQGRRYGEGRDPWGTRPVAQGEQHGLTQI